MRKNVKVVRGACSHDCPDTCSWMVEVEGGRATKLYGDPEHPFTRGTLCAKVNHYLDRVYHQDRVLYPLKRTGPKGSGEFTRVSWEEALSDIASRWQRIIAESGAEAILPYSSAGTQGLIGMSALDERLFGSMGCTGLVRAICGTVAGQGIAETQGSGWGIDPEDIVHSRFIVLWGTNTIVTNLHLWPVITEARKRGAKLVVIDPVRTRTAAAADWHIQLRPSSDGAFAMAVMNVIIAEGLVDRDYVDRYTEGFDDLAARAAQITPESAAETTGLSAEDIRRFAREYANARPSLLRPLIGIEHHRNGFTMFRTLSCLPLLTGAWRHKGGGLCRSTHSLQYSTLNMDSVTMPWTRREGLRQVNMRDLGEVLCSQVLNPAIRSLFVYNSNPAASMPNASRIREGLQRHDLFTVVHELFVTETALYADYILPAASQIEMLDLVPAWGHHYMSLNQPAIDPPGEAVTNMELMRRLARALGRTEPWLYTSDEQMLRDALDSGHPWLAGITYDYLKEHGYARLRLPEDWLPFAGGGFPTPSGKASLWPGLDTGVEPGIGEIRTGSGLQLITGKTLHYLNSGYTNLQRHRRAEGPLAIEIHAQDAAIRSLRDGERVRITSARGSVPAVCRISERMQPGVAFMPFGAERVNDLTPDEPTDVGGGCGLYDAFVEVHAEA